MIGLIYDPITTKNWKYNRPFNLHPEKWFEGYPVKSTLIFIGCTLIFLECRHALILQGRSYPPKKFRQQARKFRARLHTRKFHFSRKEGQQIKRASMYKLGEIWCLQSDFLEESEQFFLAMKKINWKKNACKLSYLKLTNTTINLEVHWINHKLRRRKIGKKVQSLARNLWCWHISLPSTVFCATAHVRH